MHAGFVVTNSCLMGDSSIAGDPQAIRMGNFYLDFDNLAQCSGFISTIRYCYQNSPSLAMNVAEARIGVYRRTGTTANRVSEEFIITNHIPFSGGTSGSVCEDLELEAPVPVNEMDMLGVCQLSTTSDGKVLPVVSGTVSRAPACGTQPVDSVSLFSYSILNDETLHLSANITSGKCSLGGGGKEVRCFLVLRPVNILSFCPQKGRLTYLSGNISG